MGEEPDPALPPLGPEKLGPAWQPAPPGPGEHVYPGVGVRTRPAPVGLAPTITVARATQLVAGLWRPVEPEVELRLVTTCDFPAIPPPGGVVDRPGWVFTYRDTTPSRHGGGHHHGRHRRPRPPDTMLLAVSTVIIDAVTGELVLNCQSVRPRPAAPPR